jgi:DNA-binding NtrC family response regulator
MNTSSHNVLVVIPDVPLLELMGEVVSNMGHVPLLFKTEKEAVSQCSNDKSIAGVVIDWELSRKYFPDILKRLHVISPYMGRFALIDMKDEEIRRHINEGDFCCYMQKPFDLDKFEKGLQGCIHEYETAIGNCECACS